MKYSHDRRAQAVINFTTHGKCRTPVYRSWCAMMTRCYNQNVRSYSDYGGRGITVCERWHKFENFYADMGDRPDGQTLDRINGDLGYSPENCRWATSKEQRANRKDVRLLTLNGETLNVTEWASRLGINPSTLTERIDRGWPLEVALTTGRSHKSKSPVCHVSRTPILRLGDEVRNLTEWAAHLGISVSSLSGRLKRGWPHDIALTAPKHYRYQPSTQIENV